MRDRIKRKIWYLITGYFYKNKFDTVGKKSVIISPMKLDNTKSIAIGDRVSINDFVWLMGSGKGVSLVIKDRTTIGHFAHIIAMHSVIIEKSVLLADKVFVTDCTHGYKKVETPVLDQPIECLKTVTIGEGSWVGENVCILGASVGKHCVVGANSVVTKDVPDYCVVVGNPARIIKRYDFNIGSWMEIKNE